MITGGNKNICRPIIFLPVPGFLLKTCLPLILFLYSCQSPHYYRPKPVEPVLLTHNRQAKINIVSDDAEFNAVSVAYSPAAHVGIAGGAGFLKEDDKVGERYFNPYLAVGYYKNFASDNLLETYAGIGVYTYQNKDDEALKRIVFHNYFVQPSFAFIRENVEVALTVRVDYLKRYKTETLNNYLPDLADPRFTFLKYHDYFFLQPGCTVRVGFKYFKFQVQASKSNPFNSRYVAIYGTRYNDEFDTDVSDHPVRFSSGFAIDLDILKTKKSEQAP